MSRFTKIGERIHISPSTWPGKELKVQPADMSFFAPQGNGLGGPMVMMPWDSLGDVLQRPGYYSFQKPVFHPVLGAPTTEAAGGTVYFDDGVSQPAFETLLSVLEVHTRNKAYVALLAQSTNTMDDRYLVQLRLMSRSALSYIFGVDAATDPELPAEQPLPLGEALWAFIEDQREAFGSRYSPLLEGCLGGDGDWARESLCFGLSVENSYHGVYRIWSRAWLVTK